MKSFRTYEEQQDYDDYKLTPSDLPNVSLVLEGTKVYYNPKGMEKRQNLTFKITSAGNINWMVNDAVSAKTITYRINKGDWNEITSTTAGTTFSVNAGDIVEFNGVGTKTFANGSKYNSFSGTTAGFIAYGNPLSLCGGLFENYSAMTPYELKFMFANCTGLTDASGMFFSALTLNTGCYWGMFQNCINLTGAPSFPTLTMAASCCTQMFAGCTSLETMPDLPATTLAGSCYNGMFSACTNLKVAKTIPANAMQAGSCQSMFQGCTGLTTVQGLPATTLAKNCYSNMFRGCTSLTTVPNLPATEAAQSCYSNMFNGCNKLVTPPTISISTVAAGFASSMFADCRGLESIPNLSNITSFDSFTGCCTNMFKGCTSLETATTPPVATVTKSAYLGMFSGCTNLEYIKCLATAFGNTNATQNWTAGVAQDGTFVKHTNMSSWTTGVNGIPNGWDVQNATA